MKSKQFYLFMAVLALIVAAASIYFMRERNKQQKQQAEDFKEILTPVATKAALEVQQMLQPKLESERPEIGFKVIKEENEQQA